MKLTLRAIYVKGLDKAKYFMTLKPYKDVFTRLINKEPFEGTFNVEITNHLSYKDLLNKCGTHYIIPDQYYDGRVLGGVYIWLGEIDGVGKVLIIRPFRSGHKENILEIVSDKKIRDILNLKYGDQVEIKIFCEENSS
ncbi:MAG: DUF120 domain-containing protein [Sulfolobales archaeon]